MRQAFFSRRNFVGCGSLKLWMIAAMILSMLVWTPELAQAGGPRWVAGSSFFNASVEGQPLTWAGDQLAYNTDLGSLSPTVSQSQANNLISVAIGVWNAVPTSALKIVSKGSLSEDVNGSNVTAGANGVTVPKDIASTVANRLAIIYDADGSVINAFFGPGASDASSCSQNGVMTVIDNLSATGTISHALMLINGLCATNTTQVAVLQYQIIRAFGRILGLDWSQTNEEMFDVNQVTSEGLMGWPLMHPLERLCNQNGIACMPNANTLRPDDIAALNRLYPVTAANQSTVPTKKMTAANTISVQGTITFRGGQGMQGVNVVLRPLIPGSDLPDVRYTVTAVSGVFFNGNVGNAITGTTDAQGNVLARFGSDNPAQEGFFDLSGVPLPPGETSADYQLTFEPVNPLFTGTMSVGPYTTSQVTPSGTMPTIVLRGLAAGSSVIENVNVENSAADGPSNDGSVATPVSVSPSGEWVDRLSGYGHMSWLQFWTRANREFTVETSALDENGQPTVNKAELVLGAWNGMDAAGTPPVTGTPQAFNGPAVGLTTLPVVTTADSEVQLGIADFRGDGRPDYLYRGRVLYADSVAPSRLPASGGAIVITGIGFRPDSAVMVNNVAAKVTSVSATEITAIAPPSGGMTGNVFVEVEDPQTQGVTIIADGLSYNAQNGDGLTILTAPANTIPTGVPVPFMVKAVNFDAQAPAGGVTVMYSVTEGTAALGCGQPTCSVTTAADGTATLMVSANSSTLAQVTAALTNGASVLAEFSGVTPPVLNALTPNLYLAIGASTQWNPQGLVLSNGAPVMGAAVTWAPGGSGVVAPTTASLSAANGMVTQQLASGPLNAGDAVAVNACLANSTTCAQFNVFAVHTETAQLVALSGASQSILVGQSFAPVTLEVTDAIGHPMAGAVVTVYETLDAWTPPCPPRGACPPAPVLAQQSMQLTSANDGTVNFTPLAMAGQSTRLYVTAVTGEQATLQFELDQNQ